jgi:hypothetical protein
MNNTARTTLGLLGITLTLTCLFAARSAQIDLNNTPEMFSCFGIGSNADNNALDQRAQSTIALALSLGGAALSAVSTYFVLKPLFNDNDNPTNGQNNTSQHHTPE